MGRTERKIPDRWEQYSPVLSPIENTRFLPFKTPLKDSLTNQMAEHMKFDFTRLIRDLAGRNAHWTLGMVIDLTYTSRYYDARDISSLGIEHVKIYCPGHELDKREDLAKQFIRTVDQYLARHPNDGTLIGVHCTHGINRTGFLICRYLIDRENWSADEAMQAFEQGRGYPIERGNYVSALNSAEARRKMAIKNKRIVFGDSDEDSADNDHSNDTAQVEKSRKKSDKSKHKEKRKKLKRLLKKDRKDPPMVSNQQNDMQKMWQLMVKNTQSVLDHPQATSQDQQEPLPSPTMGTPTLDEETTQEETTQEGTTQEGYERPAVDTTFTHPFLTEEKPETSEINKEFDDEEDEDEEMEYPVILGEDQKADANTEGDKQEDTDLSVAQRRRKRRGKLRKLYQKMRTGRFWEIREMQKEHYGI